MSNAILTSMICNTAGNLAYAYSLEKSYHPKRNTVVVKY